MQAGADVLAHGGNAADAAAATYFALAVTYPMAAGLGGGGICVVADTANARAEEFDFLPREAAGGGPYAVPGNVAGFALLQSAYGRLPWQRVISPAEGFAATGFSMSQALHARLATTADAVRLDAELAREFLDETGQLKPAGTLLSAPALAQTLSQLRVQGAGALYRGEIAEAVSAYATAQGGSIGAAELSAYRAERGPPMRVPIDEKTVFLPTDKTGAGQYAGALFARLVDGQGHVLADQPAAAVATATKAALDRFRIASLPRDLGATGFAAEDSSGQAVSCAVTMNGPFGSGHTAGDTGVVLAAAPKSVQTGLSGAFLTPAVMLSGSDLALAGAGGGGPNGTAVMALAVLDAARGNDLTRPGAFHTTGLEPFETANVIQCLGGACTGIPDPKAFGIAAAAQ